jgi:putative transcriptional regulator
MQEKQKQYGRGSLLIANASLMDPNFKRKIVLICEHNDQGSYGLIINHPTKTLVSDVFPEHDFLKNEKATLYVGGPCQVEQLQILHGFGSLVKGSIEVCGGVFLGGNIDKLFDIKKLEPDKNKPYQFFMGYSGWGPGQLDEEMENNAWIIHPADEKTVFSLDREKMWTDILRSKGDYYSLLSDMPPDIRVN